MKKKVIVISGGGTGGHIYPGLAVARAVREKYPEFEVCFVGARGGLEEKILPREGFPLYLIPVGKLHSSVGLWSQIKTLLILPWSLLLCLALLWRLRPKAVLGVGGYASGPFLFVSSLFRYPSFIWEANAIPGLTNRILSRMVSECFVVFEEAGRRLASNKVLRLGLPVRSGFRASPRKSPLQKPLKLLILGGSQGALAINEIVSQAFSQGVEKGEPWVSQLEVVHQCGYRHFESLKKIYNKFPPHIQLYDFLHDMDKRLQWADLVVSRSGASTVAEICASQRAALLIPFPAAADNHQYKNAQALASQNAAKLLDQKDITPQSFIGTIGEFIDHPEKIEEFEKNLRQFQFPDAAEKIRDHILRGIV